MFVCFFLPLILFVEDIVVVVVVGAKMISITKDPTFFIEVAIQFRPKYMAVFKISF